MVKWKERVITNVKSWSVPALIALGVSLYTGRIILPDMRARLETDLEVKQSKQKLKSTQQTLDSLIINNFLKDKIDSLNAELEELIAVGIKNQPDLDKKMRSIIKNFEDDQKQANSFEKINVAEEALGTRVAEIIDTLASRDLVLKNLLKSSIPEIKKEYRTFLNEFNKNPGKYRGKYAEIIKKKKAWLTKEQLRNRGIITKKDIHMQPRRMT